MVLTRYTVQINGPTTRYRVNCEPLRPESHTLTSKQRRDYASHLSSMRARYRNVKRPRCIPNDNNNNDGCTTLGGFLSSDNYPVASLRETFRKRVQSAVAIRRTPFYPFSDYRVSDERKTTALTARTHTFLNIQPTVTV